MTDVLERPLDAPKPATKSARSNLPLWLRRPPARRRQLRPAPTPRDIRWWVGVAWFVLSVLLVGFVAHVTIVGTLQHAMRQHVLYEQLRTGLALAVTPLGQLDYNGDLVADGAPVALITIERLGISEVVVQGTKADDLVDGPGHRRDTVMPGQEGTSVIMGRRATYGGPFAALGDLENGDTITVVTGQGTATYEVFNTRQEGDLLPIPLEEGEGRLVLVTAAGPPLAPSGALYVDAALTSDVQVTPSASFSTAVLDPSEFEMANDSTGWMEQLFWLQLLVGAVLLVRWVRTRWGTWQTWVVALPVLMILGASSAGAAIGLLDNLV